MLFCFVFFYCSWKQYCCLFISAKPRWLTRPNLRSAAAIYWNQKQAMCFIQMERHEFRLRHRTAPLWCRHTWIAAGHVLFCSCLTCANTIRACFVRLMKGLGVIWRPLPHLEGIPVGVGSSANDNYYYYLKWSIDSLKSWLYGYSEVFRLSLPPGNVGRVTPNTSKMGPTGSLLGI